MARPREFDEEQALDRAMQVFWRRGYRNTSLDDLLDGMGIQRGSFYNAFGSKRETYLKALKRYGEQLTDLGPLRKLKQEPRGLQALRRFVGAAIRHVTGQREPRGCFFAHASTEDRLRDPRVKSAVLRGLKDARGTVAETIETAQRAGELSDEIDPEELALLFLVFGYGAQVLAACGVKRDDLETGGKLLFQLLEG